ncbi:diacylglycerol O-acyltransferase [Nocardia sp. GAS34]
MHSVGQSERWLSVKRNSAAEPPGLHVTAQQLSARDAVFVYEEHQRHPANIAAAYVFDRSRGAVTPFGTEQVHAWVRDRLGHSPIFHRRLARIPGDLDLPYWVPDAGFRLADHVTLNGPEVFDWDEIRRRIAAIASTRMDLSRPPWEIHIFERVARFPGYPAVTVVVLKFHHSAADGMGTRTLESKLFGAVDIPPAPTVDHHSWSESTALLRSAGLLPYRCVRFVAGLIRTRRAARAAAASVAAKALYEPIAHRPATRFNHAVRSELVFDLIPIPLRAVLDLKAAMPGRTTVNDLMLAVISGALDAYLRERGETPAASLGAMVPMSMRGTARWNSANQLCLMSVDLHTDIADSLSRLQAIQVSARREKERWANAYVLRREARLHTSPAWLLRLVGWVRAQQSFDDIETVPLVNTTISNVPPVTERLEFLDLPGVSAFGVLPVFDGDGLRHLVSSQGEELWISVSADSKMMPDLEHYGELLRGSFRQLAEAAGSLGE